MYILLCFIKLFPIKHTSDEGISKCQTSLQSLEVTAIKSQVSIWVWSLKVTHVWLRLKSWKWEKIFKNCWKRRSVQKWSPRCLDSLGGGLGIMSHHQLGFLTAWQCACCCVWGLQGERLQGLRDSLRRYRTGLTWCFDNELRKNLFLTAQKFAMRMWVSDMHMVCVGVCVCAKGRDSSGEIWHWSTVWDRVLALLNDTISLQMISLCFKTNVNLFSIPTIPLLMP